MGKQPKKDNQPSLKHNTDLGQHFLRKQSTVDNMINEVTVCPETTVVEIGCGDGFLTRSILEQTPCKKLIIIELDSRWANFVQEQYGCDRLEVIQADALQYDFSLLQQESPLILLANLPYQITFPLFKKLSKHETLFDEAVVMLQEETAQKIAAKKGRSYGALSLYFQHYFNVKLMEKVEPGAFAPPPKVFSRLLYFTPNRQRPEIENKEKFWEFLRSIFKTPRQTLKNNLKRTNIDIKKVPEEFLGLRAQQLELPKLIELWNTVNS